MRPHCITVLWHSGISTAIDIYDFHLPEKPVVLTRSIFRHFSARLQCCLLFTQLQGVFFFSLHSIPIPNFPLSLLKSDVVLQHYSPAYCPMIYFTHIVHTPIDNWTTQYPVQIQNTPLVDCMVFQLPVFLHLNKCLWLLLVDCCWLVGNLVGVGAVDWC